MEDILEQIFFIIIIIMKKLVDKIRETALIRFMELTNRGIESNCPICNNIFYTQVDLHDFTLEKK